MKSTKNNSLNKTPDRPSQGNWLLVFAVIALGIIPLIFVKGEYSGADSQATEVISEIQPDYQPWFEPVLEPSSGEIESLLFASQAALGAGVVGYAIGFYRGRSKNQD